MSRGRPTVHWPVQHVLVLFLISSVLAAPAQAAPTVTSCINTNTSVELGAGTPVLNVDYQVTVTNGPVDPAVKDIHIEGDQSKIVVSGLPSGWSDGNGTNPSAHKTIRSATGIPAGGSLTFLIKVTARAGAVKPVFTSNGENNYASGDIIPAGAGNLAVPCSLIPQTPGFSWGPFVGLATLLAGLGGWVLRRERQPRIF